MWIPGPTAKPLRDLSEAEQKYIRQQARWGQEEGGYAMIQRQATTLAYVILSRSSSVDCGEVPRARGERCDGDVESRFSPKETSCSPTSHHHWATETINSANRLYYEHLHNPVPPVEA